jgi:hypothetical protein
VTIAHGANRSRSAVRTVACWKSGKPMHRAGRHLQVQKRAQSQVVVQGREAGAGGEGRDHLRRVVGRACLPEGARRILPAACPAWVPLSLFRPPHSGPAVGGPLAPPVPRLRRDRAGRLRPRGDRHRARPPRSRRPADDPQTLHPGAGHDRAPSCPGPDHGAAACCVRASETRYMTTPLVRGHVRAISPRHCDRFLHLTGHLSQSGPRRLVTQSRNVGL